MALARSLSSLALGVEDVASGLHRYRDEIPGQPTTITSIIAQLFAVSAVLRALGDGSRDARTVGDDLELLFATLQKTLSVAFDMFAHATEGHLQFAWQDLNVKMERNERMAFTSRLKLYQDFLLGLQDVLDGFRTQDLGPLRRQLVSLLDAQDRWASVPQRGTIDFDGRCSNIDSTFTGVTNIREGGRTPRAGGAYAPRVGGPTSPISPSREWDNPYGRQPMPRAPDPPGNVPTSPTFTSSSSQTLDSSHTSHSDRPFLPVNPQPTLVHWAQDVFDGDYPTTPFDPMYQLYDRRPCQAVTSILLTLAQPREI